MTPFVLLYLGLSLTAMAILWLKGGHPERLGALLWIAGWILQLPLNDVRFGDLRSGVALLDLAFFGAFLWLALRYERWWPLGVCACLLLVLGIHLSTLLIPEVTPLGEASAQLGLGMLAVLIQAAGAFERWLAGETPASASAVWSPRHRAT
ncbi:MAG: hypothetical protein M3Q74_01075 [Pseudomonadota bacterium]|nr:hypothetical protein [Pseudomonadota bacterium]